MHVQAKSKGAPKQTIYLRFWRFRIYLFSLFDKFAFERPTDEKAYTFYTNFIWICSFLWRIFSLQCNEQVIMSKQATAQ